MRRNFCSFGGMIRFFNILLPVFLVCSCSISRFLKGPDTSDIMALEGEGTVEAVTYVPTEEDLSQRRMIVYLPPSYSVETGRSYPVMYLIHGARGNEITWNERANSFEVLDSLRAAGEAEEFILVQVNMNNYWGELDYQDGRPITMTRAFLFEDGEAEENFFTDVVERVDSMYRTIPSKEGRAIAGMSMGGFQSLYMAANHPDAFNHIGLFSSFLYPMPAALGHMDVYGNLWDKLEILFQDPPATFNIYIGKNDIFYLQSIMFDQRLTEYGYPHNYVVTDGGHTWENWKKYLIDFYKVSFR